MRAARFGCPIQGSLSGERGDVAPRGRREPRDVAASGPMSSLARPGRQVGVEWRMMSDSEPFSQLVVVGASAGGIEALSVVVAALPKDFPVPIVVAQHLDPGRPSHLEQILAARSTLP